MSFDDDEFGGLLDRETVLAGGVPTKRANTLLFLIESRTAHLIPDFSSLRQATLRLVRNNVGAQLKVWAHKVTPEGDSEGISGLLHVRQGDETRQFDLKLSKGQVMLPVAPGTCQVDILLAEESDTRPGDSF